MQPVLTMLERIGPSDANVLITGRARHGQGDRRALAARRVAARGARRSSS
jgi:DNA-binding NtrC family response regulator